MLPGDLVMYIDPTHHGMDPDCNAGLVIRAEFRFAWVLWPGYKKPFREEVSTLKIIRRDISPGSSAG